LTKSGSVLVIGGGVSGIQASLDLGDMGFDVHLVEKEPSIGGRMAQLDKTFPTNDCSICILSPKMADCHRHPKITIHTLSEVQEINGEIGDFTVKVKKRARFVNEKDCINCGLCIEKCPVKVPDEFDMGLRDRGAIYLHYLQGVPSIVSIDRENCLYLKLGACRLCESACPRDAIDFEQQDEEQELKVGAVVVATGFDPLDPTGLTQYGYGRHENVISALEYERLICASGPTGGHVNKPSDGGPVKSIAFIQCVGSRDLDNYPYCSSVCCMHATKEAILANEHDPDVSSYIFYMDMRAAGKGFRKYVDRAEREYNTTYIRGRVAKISVDEDGAPVIVYEDMETSQPEKKTVDLAVLATSLIPREDAGELAEVLGIGADEYGFYGYDTLAPLDTKRPGIYLCGCCKEPVDIPECVSQASGAAARVAEALS